jgi:hypothetical protein
MPVKIYPFPVIHRQTLFAPGEALSAMGIERDQRTTPQLHACNPTANASMESIYTLPFDTKVLMTPTR